MATVVDQLITEYVARDKHTPVIERIAKAQERLGKTVLTAEQLRRRVEAATRAANKATETELKVSEKAEKVRTQEARTREVNARAMANEARARDLNARAMAREDAAQGRVTRSRANFISRFRNGLGSTRFDFGATSPLFSSFTRGGFAGGLGALSGAGLAGAGAGIGNLFSAGAGAIQQGISAVPGFLGSASQVAMERESRMARLVGLIGKQRAKGALSAADAVAAPSPFTTGQLADSAVQLEAFGVRAERALPIIGRLGTAMGATSEQLDMYTKSIGQLGTGNMIDSDVMAAMGLTRSDFSQKGIKFDGNGKLESSAEEALDALDRIVKERYAGVLDTMADTAEAKKASLQDAGERAMAEVGKGIARYEGPFVDRVTRLLTGAVDSGVLAETVSRAVTSFQRLTGTGSDQGVARAASVVLTTVELVPEYIRIAIRNTQEWWRGMENGARRFGAIFAAQWKFGMQTAANVSQATSELLSSPMKLLSPLTATPHILGVMGRFQERQALSAGMRDTSLKAADLYSMVPPQYEKMPNAGKRQLEIEQKLLAAMRSPQSAAFPDGTGKFLTRPQMQDDEALEKIKRATEKTAKNTEPASLNDAIFGGSTKARAGISFADLAPRGKPVIKVMVGERSGRKMDEAVRDLVQEAVGQALRAAGVA